jgi:hypothetical protein
MKKYFAMAALAALCAVTATAQDVQYKWYGFIRNYAHVDTHEMTALTADLFSYGPKDNDNENATWHFSAITSRLGLDVTGYKYNNMTATAKIEADFYNGLSGVTGTAVFRLRQAYVTLGWKNAFGNPYSLKVGQTWHPMAADMPDVISLNTGAPFGPFARTPLAQFDYALDGGISFTAAAIWQQQYTSAGPEGPSANYMKYSGIPEIYVGLSHTDANTIVRAGVDFISTKPVQTSSDRMNAIIPFIYAQYKSGLFSAKVKSVVAQAGEHVNLNGGYGVAADGGYTPTRNSSTWVSLSYGKDWQWVLFGGFAKNFGTTKALANPSSFWFSKNSASNMNTMYRVTPTVIRNLGKVQVALEYELTAVEYGDSKLGMNLQKGLYDQGLHWVKNNRVQLMLKYSF